MSQPDLFPDNAGAKLSPRLEWQARHKIHTRFRLGSYFKPWEAWVRGDYVSRYGATEEDALHALATHLEIKLWNEETKPQPSGKEPSP
jgi:hypothetical protein